MQNIIKPLGLEPIYKPKETEKELAPIDANIDKEVKISDAPDVTEQVTPINQIGNIDQFKRVFNVVPAGEIKEELTNFARKNFFDKDGNLLSETDTYNNINTQETVDLFKKLGLYNIQTKGF